MIRFAGRLILAVAALGLAGPALAEWPEKSITIVVGNPPGGPTDVFARLIAPEMEKRLGQNVIVENKPGASGIISGQYVLSRPADGYTLWMAAPTHLLLQALVREPPPYTLDDWTPIVAIAYGSGALMVSPSTGITTLQEFVDRAKAEPGKLNYASTGEGSTANVTFERIKDALGIDVAHIPYNGGAAAFGAVLSGEADAFAADIGTTRDALDKGELTALAVLGPARDPAIPDVPTADETGLLPGFEALFYLGIVAPKGVDPAAVARINQVVNETLSEPDIRARIAAFSYVPLGGTPEAYGKLMADDAAVSAPVIKKLGIRVE